MFGEEKGELDVRFETSQPAVRIQVRFCGCIEALPR